MSAFVEITGESLNEDRIHVYLVDLELFKNHFNNYQDVLSEEEIDKTNRFHFQKDKTMFATVRANLRFLLSHYLSSKPEDVKFILNDFGKPRLKSKNNLDIRFNVSHSKKLGLIAIGLGCEIGVDIEYINREFVTTDIAKNYFSHSESIELFKQNTDLQIRSFFNLWTRKESYIKAQGKGLSIPLDSFDISLSEDNPKILRIDDQTNVRDWNIYHLLSNDDYCAALTNQGGRKEILKIGFQ